MKKSAGKNQHAVALGRLGGRVRSEAKQRKSGERAEGRVGQKPPKDARLSAQRAAAPPRSPQAVKAAIALIRERFGYLAIGLGEAGIRYGRGGFAAIKEFSSERLPERLAR
jgi:hypothetical protein